MDLSKFDMKEGADAGALLELLDLEGQPLFLDDTDDPEHIPVLRMGITLLSADSRTYRDIFHKNQNLRLNANQKRRKSRDLDVAEFEEEALEALIACTQIFHNVQLEGEALEATPINARKVYVRYPFIREQAEAFMQDRSEYLGE